MAISLASAVRVPPRHRWLSLHGSDVAAPDCMAVGQIVRSNTWYPVDLADACRRRARVRTFRSSLARDSRFGPGLRTRIAAGVRALAMARPACRAFWIYSSLLDGKLDGFFLASGAASGNGISVRTSSSGGAHRWIRLARADAR